MHCLVLKETIFLPTSEQYKTKNWCILQQRNSSNTTQVNVYFIYTRDAEVC